MWLSGGTLALGGEEGERGPGRAHIEMDESQSQSHNDITHMFSYLQLRREERHVTSKRETGEMKLEIYTMLNILLSNMLSLQGRLVGNKMAT